MADRHGTPLAACLTGANRHDGVVLEALVDAIPPVRRPSGQRRCRPAAPRADTADAIPRRRRFLRRRRTKVRIAHKGVEPRGRRGRHRWVVERTLARLGQFRRLTIRYQRRQDIHDAFTSLGCSLVCCNALNRF